jgi:omega-amidase
MQNLKIALIQTEIHWENIDKNISMFSRKLDKLIEKIDLVVFPELFTTGFTMNVEENSESMNGKAVSFLKKYSKKLNAGISGSIIVKSGDKFFNRLILCLPDGKIHYYDKRHLFRMGNENLVYSNGNKHLIVRINNWRVAFFICYDLRFPVWCRNNNNYDLAVFVANWPEVRTYPWKSLLIARAIENQCYVVGVNRTGRDGNGIKYSGESVILSPVGKYIMNTTYKMGNYTAELEKEILEDYRERFPVYKDADKFKIVL